MKARLTVTHFGHLAICLSLMGLSLGGCSIFRGPASQKVELPPAGISNVPLDPSDERPIIKTQDGFQQASIPGVTPPPEEPYKYVIYTGASN